MGQLSYALSLSSMPFAISISSRSLSDLGSMTREDSLGSTDKFRHFERGITNFTRFSKI